MNTVKQYKTKDDVWKAAQAALNKTLRDFIPKNKINEIEQSLLGYQTSRKGYFGELTEEFIFGLARNTRSEADFSLNPGISKAKMAMIHSSQTFTPSWKPRNFFSLYSKKLKTQNMLSLKM